MGQKPELEPGELEAGLSVARAQRVAIFVVAYNAEAHIRDTLRRIPPELHPLLASIYVIDDSSVDATTQVARELASEFPKLRVFTTPHNLGYGGNQKLGYRYAIQQEFDVVVLLHGDGQYAPEILPRLLIPFAEPEVAAVFGSRMMVKGASRRGGMPLYKRVGNRILTLMENKLLGGELSEFHSGYRAYRVSNLAKMPFVHNTDDFHFDTEIIIQLLTRKLKIVEVPIPTYYGDEICHVNGLAYAFNCIKTIFRAKANGVHLVYHPKFDLEDEHADYEFKEAPTSLHQHILKMETPAGHRVLELGAGKGDIGLSLHEKGAKVWAVDQVKPDSAFPYDFLEEDLDRAFSRPLVERMGGRVDMVVALDVIEHLKQPERSITEIKRTLSQSGTLVVSTGNVAYLPLRLMLMFGQFNYGKKGILDLTHKRLFTIRSFRRTLEGEGFRVESVRGFGPPIQANSASW